MKKNIIVVTLIFAMIFSVSFNTQTAAGAGFNTLYMRVITDDTPFYSDKNGTDLLFYLPYTYYVKILNADTVMAHVECYGDNGSLTLDGYAPTDMLFDDGLSVTNPYPAVTVRTANSTVLYSDSTLSSAVQYIFAERNLTFYGKTEGENGINLYCVGYNNRLGYVTETDIYPFVLPTHPNELTFLETEQPPADNKTEPSDDGSDLYSLRIVIIACLISAGVIALLVALKRKPKAETAVGYYDENDYE